MRVSAKNSAMHTLHFATLLEWCIVPAASLDLRILPVFRSDALAQFSVAPEGTQRMFAVTGNRLTAHSRPRINRFWR